MARILCIDYGGKRTGLAVTDPLQIIATGLTTVDTKDLHAFIKNYLLTESIELILIGAPLSLDNTPTHATPLVKAAIGQLKRTFPAIPIQTVDERFTSKMATQAMIQMGMKKKDREVKANKDKIAATIMLQEYLANK